MKCSNVLYKCVFLCILTLIILLAFILKFPTNMLVATSSLLVLSYLPVLSWAPDDEDEKVEEVAEGEEEDQE